MQLSLVAYANVNPEVINPNVVHLKPRTVWLPFDAFAVCMQGTVEKLRYCSAIYSKGSFP